MTDHRWDPVVLSRVRHLHLRARQLTDALLQGEHRSRRVGAAVEFADFQEYVPGMDLRHLDWKVLARSDRTVIKRFETETELACTVVLDLSGDLATGSAGKAAYPDLDASKAGAAITMAATLLYFLHRHGEPVGLELVAGSVDAAFAPGSRGGSAHLQQLFLALATARPGGVAELAVALGRVGERVRRRSLVVVITDGMEEPEAWLPSIGALARRRVDLRFVHLHDPGEWSLAGDRPVIFYSPEGGDALPIDPDGARAAFAEVVRDYVREVRGGVVGWGGRYLSVSTADPLEASLRRIILAAPEPESAWG